MKRCLNERGSRGEPPLLIIPLRKPQLLKGSKGLLMALQKPVRPKRVLAKPLVLSPIERKRVCNCSHKASLNSSRRGAAYLFFQPSIALCLEALGQRGIARAYNATVHHHMHKIGLHVVQKTLIVRYHQKGAIGTAKFRHCRPHSAQRIYV